MNNLLTLYIQNTADLLACCRVSQDGWAKVLERTVTDLHDLAAALQGGKIVAHVPTHLSSEARACAMGCEASAGLIRSSIAKPADSGV